MARNGNGATPEAPTDVYGRGWGQVLKRTFKEFREDQLTDQAAALTYYGGLALFPALIALVSIVGLLGQSTVDGLVTNIQAIPAAPESKKIVVNAITDLSRHGSQAGLAFVVGLALALWSASGYVGAFMRASNRIYESPEGRPFYELRPLQIGVTFLMLVLLALSVAAIVITG